MSVSFSDCCKHNKILGECCMEPAETPFNIAEKAGSTPFAVGAQSVPAEILTPEQRFDEDAIRRELKRDDLPPGERRMLRSLIYGQPDRKPAPLFKTGGTMFRHGQRTFAPFQSGTPQKPDSLTGRQFKKKRKEYKRAVRLVLAHQARQGE